MNDLLQSVRWLLVNNDISLERLWIRYWAQGGNAAEFEYEALIYGVLVPEPVDLVILRQVLDDLDIG
ncbi:hypothetical protein [Arthrobacter sp. efr-133-TYG-104]|uniref:hypothetical protein n=1 Tax=Arthrobacter sp. efr-133-TYG-104 TaxID=3040324 RepID=UPI00254AA960|nr:hypothetical protein [Arthrobacter sp. efr-133-TYG-104]